MRSRVIISTNQMAHLSYTDKIRIEKLLGMGSGYVLNFSDRTFQEFVLDSVRVDMYAPGMDAGGTSKAKRLRHFWRTQPDHVVGKLLGAFFDYYQSTESKPDRELLALLCYKLDTFGCESCTC